MAVAQPATVCRPASSPEVGPAPATKLGASLTAVTVIVKLCGGDVSTPPLTVPPSSFRTSVIVAVPLAFDAEVNVNVPVGDTAGAALKSVGFVLPVTLNVSVWPVSPGPWLIAGAQLAIVCAPLSSSAVGPGPAVKLGAWLIGVTVMVNVCGADVSTPPFAVPPSSLRTSVIVDVPLTPGAAV